MAITRKKFIQISALTTSQLFLLSLATRAGWRSPVWKFNQKLSAKGPGLLDNFLQPADQYKSSCYWWWFNGLINKAGITRDLEAYREKGMGAVLLVNSAGGLGGVPFPQGAPFLSEAWKELYRHAMKEAKRLKIDIGVNLCSGWCMGGPWIKPENAGRWYLQTRLSVTGPKRFSGKLPLPDGRSGYDKVFNPPGYKSYIDLPLSELDYRDSAIIAFKDPGAGGLIEDERKKVLDAKTNHRDASNFARAGQIMDPTRENWSIAPSDRPIDAAEVIDLTSFVQKDGQLDWEVPEGNWIILRTGHRMTGSKLMIAQPEADGLSVDWFDAKGVELQFEHLGKMFLKEAAKVGNQPPYFCDDSFEDGFPNWTDKMTEQFKHYRGYDPTPYLAALSGYIVGSAIMTDRFLTDYRKSLGDLMADQHYKRFADLCHENGLSVQNESAGPSRSATMCMDGLKNLGRSDFPMGEFWLGPNHEDQSTLTDDKAYGVSRLDLGQNKVCKMVASAAHIYGKKTASAEAFTSFRHWKDCPGTLKQALDRAYCEGINRIAIHTSTATRPEDGKPGYEYGAGTHFNPNVTWWEQSNAFFDYVARCQAMLQSGQFVADVLFYNGDGAPNLVAQKHIDPSLGQGYDYDVCNEEVLLERLLVKNGKIVLPDGMHYEVLVLPENNERMPLPVVLKIEQLVQSGAWVIGPMPKMDSGLKDYPNCDQQITTITYALWSGLDGQQSTRNKYGQGQVIYGETIRAVLESKRVPPDFLYEGEQAWIDFIHRAAPEADYYFLTNRKKAPAATVCSFRMPADGGLSKRKAGTSDIQPTLWDPVLGKVIRDVQYEVINGRIRMHLNFDIFQSLFVVLSEKELQHLIRSGDPSGQYQSDHGWLWQKPDPLKTVQTLHKDWMVTFDPKWGGPAAAHFDQLSDWSMHRDKRIKYYSGKAVYHHSFDLPEDLLFSKEATPLFLDLGVVKDMAAVRLNGQTLGIVWTAPWRIDISGAVKRTGNKLEIDVINQWPNRLIGDAALPEEARLTNTNIEFKPDDPLMPSGLLGPVTIQFPV